MSKKQITASTLCLTLLLSACTSTPSAPYDRYEPYNRAMYRFNDGADKVLLKPLATGYKTVVPSPVRTGVSNFFDNLRDVYSAGANLLRGEPKKAFSDVLRFATNSSLGLLGLLDVASHAGLPNQKNTLGDTFTAWGWKNTNYFVIPLLGPSTMRDGLGQAVSFAIPGPEKWFYSNTKDAIGYYGLYGINIRAKLLGAEGLLDTASIDPYSYTRDAYMQLRAQQLGLSNPIEQVEDENNLDELLNSVPATEDTEPTPSEQNTPEDSNPPVDLDSAPVQNQQP